jgi:galactokinase/mevalonate kinase-like predicted kinase/SAM-dependent methyltransferase
MSSNVSWGEHADSPTENRARAIRFCNICGFHGCFESFGYDRKREAQCPQCGSLERHRLLKLWFDRVTPLYAKCRLLHFAPEDSVKAFVKPLCGLYVTADLHRDDVDLKLNIEALDLDDESFDALLCFHVLEHVNDKRALAEINRILVPGGLAILGVPIVEGWDVSYENPDVSTPKDRLLHFGNETHVRRYGRDFRERFRLAGFELTEVVPDGQECVTYGLVPGERIFVGRKANEGSVPNDLTHDARSLSEAAMVRPLSGSLRRGKTRVKIIASAPARVDLAGRLDIARYFFQFPQDAVGTSNIAINLRTTITYVGNTRSAIILRCGNSEERGKPYFDPSNSKFPYFWSGARHFSAPAGEYTIETSIPPSSGLGGSSCFIIALLSIVLWKKGHRLDNDDQKMRAVMLAYLFENALGLTCAGFQDYLSATFGLAHYWSWGAHFDKHTLIADRRPIILQHETTLLTDCILIGFTGEPHLSNRLDIDEGLNMSPTERKGWITVGQLGCRFARLLRERSWRLLATTMKEERRTWLEVTGEQMSPKVKALIAIADEAGVGARFAGVASGGTVWAIGAAIDIAKLSIQWQDAVLHWPNASVRIAQIDSGLTTASYES